MINEVLAGCAIALNKEFGDSYRIYKNDVGQGLEEPCFFIETVSMAKTPYIGTRHRLDIALDVLYIPKIEGNNGEMLMVADRMLSALEWIKLQTGELLRGIQMHSEIQDGILHCLVTYFLYLRTPAKNCTMEDLRIREEQIE